MKINLILSIITVVLINVQYSIAQKDIIRTVVMYDSNYQINLVNIEKRDALLDSVTNVMKKISYQLYKHNLMNDFNACVFDNFSPRLYSFEFNEKMQIINCSKFNAIDCEFFDRLVFEEIGKLKGEILKINETRDTFYFIVVLNEENFIEYFNIY